MGLDVPGVLTAPGAAFIYEALASLHEAVQGQCRDPAGRAVRHMQHEQADCVLSGRRQLQAFSRSGTSCTRLRLQPRSQRDRLRRRHDRRPVFLREDDNIGVAISKMSIGGFRHPAARGAAPVSVVSIMDVFQRISPNLL
jgi:hypothetical protein